MSRLDAQEMLLRNLQEPLAENRMHEELEAMRYERDRMREELIQQHQQAHEQRAYEEARMQHELEALRYQQFTQTYSMSASQREQLKEAIRKAQTKTKHHFKDKEDLFEI